MYLTLHAVVGAALARVVGTPGAGFVVGVGSHYALDAIPHGDEIVARWVKMKPTKALAVGLVDLATLAVAMTIMVTMRTDRALLVWGAVGSLLPDLVSNIVPFVHRNVFRTRVLERLQRALGRSFLAALHRWHNRLHYGLHNPFKIRLSFVTGVVFQTITSIAILVGLLG
ncbi:MAG: hypothetical protein HY340_03285 [Candidatus Kerfeldbacteria bacterium]|nr:hypothetical protein [Candidatus Kerfeldbacteria bacterium]